MLLNAIPKGGLGLNQVVLRLVFAVLVYELVLLSFRYAGADIGVC